MSRRTWSITTWPWKTSCTSRRTRSATATTTTTPTPEPSWAASGSKNFANPTWAGQFCCPSRLHANRRRREHHRRRNGQAVLPVPRSRVADSSTSITRRFPINPFMSQVGDPAKIIYTEPRLAPGGAGPKPGPPEIPPAVSAYTGLPGDPWDRRARCPARIPGAAMPLPPAAVDTGAATTAAERCRACCCRPKGHNHDRPGCGSAGVRRRLLCGVDGDGMRIPRPEFAAAARRGRTRAGGQHLSRRDRRMSGRWNRIRR